MTKFLDIILVLFSAIFIVAGKHHPPPPHEGLRCGNALCEQESRACIIRINGTSTNATCDVGDCNHHPHMAHCDPRRANGRGVCCCQDQHCIDRFFLNIAIHRSPINCPRCEDKHCHGNQTCGHGQFCRIHIDKNRVDSWCEEACHRDDVTSCCTSNFCVRDTIQQHGGHLFLTCPHCDSFPHRCHHGMKYCHPEESCVFAADHHEIYTDCRPSHTCSEPSVIQCCNTQGCVDSYIHGPTTQSTQPSTTPTTTTTTKPTTPTTSLPSTQKLTTPLLIQSTPSPSTQSSTSPSTLQPSTQPMTTQPTTTPLPTPPPAPIPCSECTDFQLHSCSDLFKTCQPGERCLIQVSGNVLTTKCIDESRCALYRTLDAVFGGQQRSKCCNDTDCYVNTIISEVTGLGNLNCHSCDDVYSGQCNGTVVCPETEACMFQEVGSRLTSGCVGVSECEFQKLDHTKRTHCCRTATCVDQSVKNFQTASVPPPPITTQKPTTNVWVTITGAPIP